MYAVITSPDTGAILQSRELPDDEIMDAHAEAEQYAHMMGEELDYRCTGHVPNCCGDFRVEFRPDPDNSVHIWAGQSFYFAREE